MKQLFISKLTASLAFLALFTVITVSGTGLARAADEQRTVFTNVNVVTMQGDKVLENRMVVISGDVIEAMAPQGYLSVPEGAQVIDGAGRYLMPGLAEMHGHVPPLTPFEGVPERYVDDVLFLYLAGGVTTVRGMLGYPHQLQLREEVRKGERLGPDLYLAGPSFNGNTVQSKRDARKRVQEHVEQGWDLLKVHPGLGLDEYQAMAEEAKKHGIDFAGHVPEEVGIRHAIILGSRTIDHLDGYIAEVDGFDKPLEKEDFLELARLTRQHNTAVVPTQALWETIIGAANPDELRAFPEIQYVPQQVRQGWENYLEQSGGRYYTGDTAAIHAENRRILLNVLYEEGVTILMGTDAPQLFSVPGLSLRRELPAMAAAGMTNLDILRSGTVEVGRYFNEELGYVLPGYKANLILVESNPFQQLDTVYDPEGVLILGRWLTREFIDEKLAEIAEAYK